MSESGRSRQMAGFGRAALVVAGISLVAVVVCWAMGAGPWILVPASAAAVFLVVGVVLVRAGRSRPDESAPTDACAEPVRPEIPMEHQPVASADQAQGYGWMRASDLAKSKDRP